jgi:photosystem II stability/assembly factor-like uncharacterized protein
VFVLLFLNQAVAGWTPLYLPGRYDCGASLSFVTPDTGFVAEGYHIWKTSDGGLSFRNVAPDSGGNGSWIVHDLNDTLCVACYEGGSCWADVWKSNNGGESWRKLLRSVPFPVAFESDDWILFPCPNYGYVVMDTTPNLLRTTDGGETWTPAPVPVPRLYGISFLDSLNGFASSPYTLMRTTDGGAHWDLVASFADTVLGASLRFVSLQKGYVCAQFPNEADVLMKTTDGGATWQKILALRPNTGSSTDYFERMSLVSEDTVFVLSEWESGSRTGVRLYKTCNGHDFHRVQLPGGVESSYGMFFCPGTQTGYLGVLQNQGDSTCFPILKTVDGGGESLGFWRQRAQLPEKPTKGVAWDFVPDSAALFLLMKGSGNLWSYNLTTDSWRSARPIPTKFRAGSMVYDGIGLVVSKTNSDEFWSFELDCDSWIRLPSPPEGVKVKKGGCITSDAGDPIFVLTGGKTNEFWTLDRATGAWSRHPDIPGTPPKAGTCCACDDDFVYVLKGGKSNELWAYSIAGDSWLRLPDIPGAGVKEGACLAANPRAPNNRVVALKGGTSECWSYELDGYWQLRPGIAGKKAKQGAQLTADDANSYYAILKARAQDLWQTDELAGTLPVLAPENRDATVFAAKTGGVPIFRPTGRPGQTLSAANTDPAPRRPQFVTPSDGRNISMTSGDWRTLAVYDISGRRLMSFARHQTGQSAIELPSPLAKGIYLIRTGLPGREFTGKLVVTK